MSILHREIGYLRVESVVNGELRRKLADLQKVSAAEMQKVSSFVVDLMPGNVDGQVLQLKCIQDLSRQMGLFCFGYEPKLLLSLRDEYENLWLKL